MIHDKTLDEYREKAEHYKAIGSDEISLWGNNDLNDRPWEYVVDVQASSSFHLGVPTGLRFVADDISGLRFSWHTNLETVDSNGRAQLKPDYDLLRGILTLLPELMQAKAREALDLPLGRARQDIREMRQTADRMQTDLAHSRLHYLPEPRPDLP